MFKINLFFNLILVLFPKFASYLMKKKWLQPLDPMVIDFLKELANHIINERKLGKTVN